MKLRRRRRIEVDSSSSSNTGMMMNLSLFIMLLAFFIVLNSLSQYEEAKTAKVQRSVELAFAQDARQEDFSPSVSEDAAKSVNNGDTFERLEALFESEIASFEMSKSTAQGIMQVKVPYDKFKQAITALNQQDLTRNPTRFETRGNFFLPTLSSLMRTNIDGAPTRLEIYLNADDNPARIQNVKPRELNEIIIDAGVFSKALEAQGVPQKLLNIGVSKGDPDFVDLVFKKYEPFSPVAKVEAVDG